jgi:hypothetical protein
MNEYFIKYPKVLNQERFLMDHIGGINRFGQAERVNKKKINWESSRI